MPKIEVGKVGEILKASKLDRGTVEVLMEAIRREAESAEQEKTEKKPREKRQYVVLISDPDGKIPKEDLVGWVLQIPEMASPMTVEDRIRRAAYDFNQSARGRKNPVSTIGEACEAVAQKNFREAEIAVKTKVPVAVLVTDNKIPMEPAAVR